MADRDSGGPAADGRDTLISDKEETEAPGGEDLYGADGTDDRGDLDADGGDATVPQEEQEKRAGEEG